MVEDISDEDICNAVLGVIGGGAENPEDTEDEDIVPCLTHCEALATISGLQRYVQSIDTMHGNSSFFWSSNTVGCFQGTKISDFFI